MGIVLRWRQLQRLVYLLYLCLEWRECSPVLGIEFLEAGLTCDKGRPRFQQQQHNNQSVAGNVWERPRPVGGHGSGPLRPRSEFSWGGSVGLPKAAPPSLLGKKAIKAQATINRQDRTFGSPRDRAGGHGSDPLCPLFDLGRVATPGGLRPPQRSLWGSKSNRNTQTTINC